MSSLLMRRPNLTDLPEIPALPAGYTLRPAVPEDDEALASVLQSAFPDEMWSPERVHLALLDAPDVEETLLIANGNSCVATASARISPEFPGSGYLHQVAVHPDTQGQKLGYIVSLAVLHEFARRGCKDAVLETDDHRLAAIKTYQNLGFVPEHSHESHAARWVEIFSNLAAAANL